MTHYSKFSGDVCSSGVCALRYFTTLCCNPSKVMLYISIPEWSLGRMVSPGSLKTFSSIGAGEAYGVTLVSFSMRSYPDLALDAPPPYPFVLLVFHLVEKATIPATAHPCSSLDASWESSTCIRAVCAICASFTSSCSCSCSCNFSPYYSLATGWESSTYIGVVFIFYTSCTSSYSWSYSCSCCASFSLLQNSYYSLSFCWTSCNILSISSNLLFSLFICTTLLSLCHLFKSISKHTFSTSVSSLNL